MSSKNVAETAKNYYDSQDADNFYYHIWGGEDIHIGIYNFEGEPIRTASNRSIESMAEELPEITKEMKVLDLGSGYGGGARYLANKFGCHVTCINISETENERNREKNKEQGLDDLITVKSGNFEVLPFEDNSFDIVWSSDAFLHSGNKPKIIEEAARVIKPGGHLIFTDPMQRQEVDQEVLEPILARIHLSELGSVKKYRALAEKHGFEEVNINEMPEQLVNHYSSVLREMTKRDDDLQKVCSKEYLENMKNGLTHWINGGNNGYLNWGIMHFKKK